MIYTHLHVFEPLVNVFFPFLLRYLQNIVLECTNDSAADQNRYPRNLFVKFGNKKKSFVVKTEMCGS